jgi:hypothetical protein
MILTGHVLGTLDIFNRLIIRSSIRGCMRWQVQESKVAYQGFNGIVHRTFSLQNKVDGLTYTVGQMVVDEINYGC